MSYELRRVPPDWQHPTLYGVGSAYLPKLDQPFVEAARDWLHDFQKALADGEEVAIAYLRDKPSPGTDNLLDEAWTAQEATHFQVYEWFSCGTPISPVFATLAEVRTWLITGDLHWTPERADSFLENGWSLRARRLNEQGNT